MQPAGAIHFVPDGITVADAAREAVRSGHTRLPVLLRRMLDERRHMVLVSDERERTLGLVTLEDLVEELVGEIESDTEIPPPLRLTVPRD
jgi:CBS domain containing-hemolysin-like protein